MTWPTAASKTNLDQTSDDPKQARSDLADFVDKFNDLRSHVSSFMQTFLSRSSASSARDDLDLGDAATFDVASEAEAEAGVSSTTLMTPERTEQAIDQERQWATPQYADITSITPSSTINVNMESSNDFEIDGQSTSFTLNFTNIQKGQGGKLIIVWSGSPGDITAGTGVRTSNGAELVPTGGSDSQDIISFYAYDTDKVACVIGSNFTTVS